MAKRPRIPGAAAEGGRSRADAGPARTRFIGTAGLAFCALLASEGLRAEVLTVAGKGEAPVPAAAKKEQAAANRAALEAAEGAAVRRALELAVTNVYGARETLGTRADEVYREVEGQRAVLVRESEVRRADVSGALATVEVVLKVDGAALRDYLRDVLGLSLVEGVEGKFRVYVLAYTVEGQDADRSAPPVLREEVTDDRNDVRHDQRASSSASAEERSESASLKASGAGSARASARLEDGSQGSAGATSRESLDAQASASASANRRSSSASDEFHDRSTRYHRIVVYADPGRRGAGTTNEVRAKLGELLKATGFTTAFADVALLGKAFANEDELYAAVLGEMKGRPEVRPEDYVAVALNRFTPVVGGSARMTAQVVYRVFRLGDGELLVPDKVVAADSGEQASEDVARTVATELALRKVDDVLPREVSRAVRQLGRAEARSAEAAARSYPIRVENVASPAATRELKAVLRGAGLVLASRFRGEARTEEIDVALPGKTGEDVMALLEPLLDAFDVVSLDSRSAVLRAR